MKTWISAGAGMVLLVTLVGCTGPVEPDPDEVQAWITSQRDADQGAYALGSVLGVASPTLEADEGISLHDLPDVTVYEIEFSCFGEEKMTLDYYVGGGWGGQGGQEQEIVCADSPHTIELNLDDVTDVRLNGVSPLGAGGWIAIPRGGN